MKLTMHGKSQAINFLGKFFGISSDFNQARAGLLKYGIALVPDSTTATGYRLEPYDADTPADSTPEIKQAASEFTEEIGQEEE